MMLAMQQMNAISRRSFLHVSAIGLVGAGYLGAPPVFARRALAARQTAMDLRSTQLHQFGFDAFLFHFAEYVAEQNRGIAASSRTAVESDHLPIGPSVSKLHSPSWRAPRLR